MRVLMLAMQVLMFPALWILLWVMRRSSLPAHFDFYRLRLRGQLSHLFKHRKLVSTFSVTRYSFTTSKCF